MNILFVSGHPAQVHNFRLVREELIRRGHQVFWLTAKKDIATNLLDIYGIPYALYHKPKKNIISQLWALLRNTLLAMRFIRKHHIDVTISRTDPYSAFACFLLRRKHIIIDDTEHAALSIRQKPFALMGTSILVPDCFWYEISPRQQYFAGNIELFYCHPNRFQYQEPWALLNLAPNTPYAIVRFVKWDAYHDTHLVGGFTLEQKRELVRRLSEHMHVFISSETELPADLEPYRIRIPIERMHDVQAAAALFVGESATMASESVVLGTPAIYIDEVGRGYTDEEARVQLLYMFRPVPNKEALSPSEKPWILGGVEECIDTAVQVASSDFNRAAWQQKHHAWMQTKIDPTAWLTWMIEGYPQSAEEYRLHRDEVEARFR